MFPKAKKHLGQNFLKNTKILEAIVGEASLEKMHVLEVWPGPGDLTQRIIKKNPLSLSLVELDRDMIPLLQERFPDNHIRLYNNDILKTNITFSDNSSSKKGNFQISTEKEIQYGSPYFVYWNIPYYITSPIIHHFLYDVDFLPTAMVFTMQKEVAERILNQKHHTVLSLSCHLIADIKKICDINPNNFTPAPKVWSTCLHFRVKEVNHAEARNILNLIKKWFLQKRKKLITNLSQSGYQRYEILKIFEEMGVSENVRAEELSLEEWKYLHSKIEEN